MFQRELLYAAGGAGLPAGPLGLRPGRRTG